MDTATPQFTDLLMAWREGDQDAFDRLAALVQAELHRLARHYLRGEREGHTLQTTGLVNEAWQHLLERGEVVWENRAHFVAVAATAMRCVLVDAARAHQYQKRGGGAVQVSLHDGDAIAPAGQLDVVAIHEALERLKTFNANAECVVQMRFFGGFQNKEIAEAMGISEAAATRYWKFALVWLRREFNVPDNRPVT